MSCGIGLRHGPDCALLWCRLAATALIQPLAWELPYAAGVAIKREKHRRREKRNEDGVKKIIIIGKTGSE